MTLSTISVVKVNNTIRRVSKWAFWGRRLDTRPGEIMVIPEGVLDYENEAREYRDGEIVYVGNHQSMLDRQVIIYREYVGSLSVNQRRSYVGVGQVSIDVKLTVRMENAIQYMRREIDVNDPVSFNDTHVANLYNKIEKKLLEAFDELNLDIHHINQQVVGMVNKELRDFGLVIHRNEAVVDVYVPAVIQQIGAECQAIDEWLVASLPQRETREGQLRFLMEQYSKLFTSTSCDNWLLGVNGHSRGKPFFDLAMSIPDHELVAFVNEHGLSAARLQEYKRECDLHDIKQIMDSKKIMRTYMS